MVLPAGVVDCNRVAPGRRRADSRGMLVQGRRFAVQAALVARVYAGYKLVQMARRLRLVDTAESLRRQHQRSAEAIFAMATRLEGLPIKVCQFLGSRADILPDEYVRILSQLQDQVPPRPFETLRPTVEQSWGQSIEAVCVEFDVIPVAAASLAQVHRARLRDGRDVAVKIQYPEVADLVTTDLQNFAVLVGLLGRLEPDFDFTVLLKEIRKLVPLELDFENEAANARRVQGLLRARTDILVPPLVDELCGPKVLVSDFAEGVRVTDVAALRRFGLDPRDVAARLTDVFCQMILVHGFFHGDPHPGNILVQRDGRLVLLDFGLAKEFEPEFRAGVVRITMAIMGGDHAQVAAAFRAIGFRTKHPSDETLAMLGETFLGFIVRNNKAYADADLIKQFNESLPPALKANPIVEIPSDILLLGRVMGLLSGVSKQLGSEVDVGATIMPYLVGGGVGASA